MHSTHKSSGDNLLLGIGLGIGLILGGMIHPAFVFIGFAVLALTVVFGLFFQ